MTGSSCSGLGYCLCCHILFRSPITDIVWKTTGSLKTLGGFQSISRDADDNGKMKKNVGGRTKRTREKCIVYYHQHSGDDLTLLIFTSNYFQH